MGILHVYRHKNLAHPAGRRDVDGLGPRIGPSLMIAAGDGLGGVGWVVKGYADDGLVLLYAGAALYESNSTSIEMLRSTIFWLLYALFVCVSASGLMATAQLGPSAQDERLADTTVTGANTLSVALVVHHVLNGFARPFSGRLSDRIGRVKRPGHWHSLWGRSAIGCWRWPDTRREAL